MAVTDPPASPSSLSRLLNASAEDGDWPAALERASVQELETAILAMDGWEHHQAKVDQLRAEAERRLNAQAARRRAAGETATGAVLARMSERHPSWHLVAPDDPGRAVCGRLLGPEAVRTPWTGMVPGTHVCAQCGPHIEQLPLDTEEAEEGEEGEVEPVAAPAPPSAGAAVASDGGPVVLELPLDVLDPAEDNPRGPIDLEQVGGLVAEHERNPKAAGEEARAWAEMVASVQAQGILQRLVVTPHQQGRYLIVMGHRRQVAARLAGLATVPCEVRDYTPHARRAAMLGENLHREGLTALQEARTYQAYVDEGLGQREIAKRTGRSQPTINKRLKLLSLPEVAQAALTAGTVSVRQAEQLAKLADEPDTISELVSGHAAQVRTNLRRTLDGDIAAAQEHRRRRARGQQVRADLTRQGLQVIERPDDGWWDALARPLEEGGEHVRCLGWRRVNVQLAEHAGMDCHAAAICEHGVAVWMCCDSRLHEPADDQRGASAPTAEQLAQRDQVRREAEAAKQAEDKELTARTRQRTQFMIDLFAAGGTTADDDAELCTTLAWALVDDHPVEAAKLACKLLDVEVPVAHADTGYREPRGPLRAYAAQGDTELRRAALAVALSLGDQRLRWQWGRWGQPQHVRHFDWLQHHGYPISDAERRRLERDQAAEAAPEDDA